MTTLGNRIHVRGDFQYDEAVANSAILPGNIIRLRTDGKVEKQGTAGEQIPFKIAIEDAESGPSLFRNSGGQTDATAYAQGDLVPHILPGKGSVVNAILKVGFNYTPGTKLCFDGAGRLFPDTAIGSANIPHGVAEVFDVALDLTVSGAVDTLHPVLVI